MVSQATDLESLGKRSMANLQFDGHTAEIASTLAIPILGWRCSRVSCRKEKSNGYLFMKLAATCKKPIWANRTIAHEHCVLQCKYDEADVGRKDSQAPNVEKRDVRKAYQVVQTTIHSETSSPVCTRFPNRNPSSQLCKIQGQHWREVNIRRTQLFTPPEK